MGVISLVARGDRIVTGISGEVLVGRVVALKVSCCLISAELELVRSLEP